MQETSTRPKNRTREERETLTIRLAGDSGDGIQLIGGELANVSAFLGNDLRVLPDYPAEIRAPAGTLAGVSAYQLKIASDVIYTAGDEADVLIAMNPAALSANLSQLKTPGSILINEDNFNPRAYKLAGLAEDFLERADLGLHQLIRVPMSTLTVRALAETNLPHRLRERSKNLFALGLVLWLTERGLEHSEKFIEQKFKGESKKLFREANLLAVRAGYAYGDAGELYLARIHVPPKKILAHAKSGVQPTRSVTGNEMIAEGLYVGAYRSGVQPFYASYPITPASDILHSLAGMKQWGMATFQAEDEMGAVMAAIGASYGGALGMTGTSGPGFTLKMEAISLAVMAELPLVIVDVQRAGPSTGMPTKTEQSDLMLALSGRHGETPVAVVAAASPADCFTRAMEACVWAIRYRMPVIVLSDAVLANGSEHWSVPDLKTLPVTDPQYAMPLTGEKENEVFSPYKRTALTKKGTPLQRPWAVPGMATLMHRLGGLEKDYDSGAVSYDGVNHERMIRLRAEKVAALQHEIPLLEVEGESEAELLVLGWGGTYGVIKSALIEIEREQGQAGFAYAHLRHLAPFPSNLKDLLQKYRLILVIEINLGQLAGLIRAQTKSDVQTFNKIQGRPFKIHEVRREIEQAKSNLTRKDAS